LKGQDPTLVEYDEVYESLKVQDEKYQEKKQLKQSIRGKPKVRKNMGWLVACDAFDVSSCQYVEKLIMEAEKRKHQVSDLFLGRRLV
jgi:hypothetical protein